LGYQYQPEKAAPLMHRNRAPKKRKDTTARAGSHVPVKAGEMVL
jgi:hypothetical protein